MIPSFVKPLAYAFVTSGWGDDRSYRGPGATHEGLDFRAQEGTPVYAVAAGKVTTSKLSPDNPAGEWIGIDHGNGWLSRYMHLSKRLVKVSQAIVAGQLIGYSGSSGISRSQPHLHFDLKLNGKGVPSEPHIPVDGYTEKVLAKARSLGLTLRGTAAVGGVGLLLLLVGGYFLWKWSKRRN